MGIVGRCVVIPAVLGLLLVAPQYARAYSFGGSDWLLDMAGTFHVDTTLISDDYPVNETDIPLTITQSSTSNIVIPITVPDPLNLVINANGTVTGTHLVATASISQTDPISTTYGTIRLLDVTARLEGDVDAINSADNTGGYGARAYGIAGDASNSYIDIGSIELDTTLGWWDIGDGSLEITSWRADRPAGVPEPGTIAMLLGLAASLTGYGWWKRRSL